MTQNADPSRILLVASAEDDRASLRRLFDRAGLADVIEEVSDPDLALVRGASGEHELLVIVHRPHETGIELLAALRERSVVAPILLVTERLDEELEEAAFNAGASDFLTREELNPNRIRRRVRHLVRLGRADAEAAASVARAQATTAARDQLLAVVSHDLRSPLNAIVLACDALDASGEGDHNKYVGAIRRASQRAERLLRDLLEVSRIESGALKLERRAVSVRAILEQSRTDHEMQARDAGTHIEIAIDGDPGVIDADRDRVLQVMTNLIGNALKHAPGSAIVLEARGFESDVELAVSDRGPGIAEDQLPHVFDRYWQGRRRRSGAGLGLSIVKGIVEAHGGTIAATSDAGHGARFSVRLPRPG